MSSHKSSFVDSLVLIIVSVIWCFVSCSNYNKPRKTRDKDQDTSIKSAIVPSAETQKSKATAQNENRDAPKSETSEFVDTNSIKPKTMKTESPAHTSVFMHNIPTRIYVTPLGGGDGSSLGSPVAFQSVLISPNVIAGDTILMRNGIYAGDFVSKLEGEAEKAITLMPYNQEKPAIDGSLNIEGQHTIWRDLEIYYSSWTTRTSAGTGVPSDIPYKRFRIRGNSIICSGLIIHDLAEASCFDVSMNTTITGCLSYNIGWIGGDRSHGHGFYIKNKAGRKVLRRNVICNPFRQAISCYREGSTMANNIDLIENTCINAAAPANLGPPSYPYFLLVGGASDENVKNPRWHRNMTYNCRGNYGYGAYVTNGELVDNYWHTYCILNPANTYDLNSGNLSEEDQRLANIQFCYEDEYNKSKGILTYYNWLQIDSVTADLSNITGLSAGDTVRLRCAEDYHKCYQDIVLNSRKCVTIDMKSSSHTVATAIGHDYTPLTNCPDFGCFLIEKL